MKKPGTIPVFIFAFLLLSFQIPAILFIESIDGQEVAVEFREVPPVEIQATVTGSLPQVNAGYCQLGQTTVTFTNLGQAGDPLESIINDLALGIGLGPSFQLMDGAFEIVGIRIAGIDLNDFSAMNSLNGHVQFSTDPDGPNGLSDSDNDGFFDDLELGNKVEITAFYRLNCNLTNTSTGNCTNDLSSSLNAKMDYFEQGSLESIELVEYLAPLNETEGFQTISSTDAFLSVDTFFLIHTLNKNQEDFDFSCNGEGEIRAKVILPFDVAPILGETYLQKDGTSVPILNSFLSNDTLELVFSSSSFGNLGGEYSIRIAFIAKCFAMAGPSNFEMEWSHFCPSCECGHTWFCGNLPGPQLHVTSPPCPIEVLPPCDKGVKAIDFSVERTTFGFSDLNFTLPFPPSEANKQVAIGCDSVRMRLTSIVGANPVFDSIGVVIEYANPDGSNNPDELFLFDEGTVRFTHLGSDFTCSVGPNDLSVQISGDSKSLQFDLHQCLLDFGLPLTTGDTVEFTGNFYINPDGAFESQFKEIPQLRSYAYSEEEGEQLSCDNFGDSFFIGKTDAVYEFPEPPNGQVNGCEEKELHFQIAVPENDFATFFGEEYRASNRLNSFSLNFNPSFFEAYEYFEIEASIPGHPLHGNGYFPLRPLSDFPLGNYQVDFDTLIYVPSLNGLMGHTLDIRLRFRPNCQAEVFNNLELLSQVTFRDRFYAQNIGDGSCVKNRLENGNSIVEFASFPQLEFTPLTSVVDSVSGNIAEWTVQVCNISNGGPPALTWFAVENIAGELDDIALVNVTNPGNPTAIPLIPYPNGVFGFDNTIPNGDCLDLMVQASANDCGDFAVNLLSGWNCSSYPPVWNPAINAPCSAETISLEVVNQLSAAVEMSFSNVISTCVAGGGELITVAGLLSVDAVFPTDDFTLKFVHDENGNGLIDVGEAILAEQTITGAIAPNNPLSFQQAINSLASQACSILVTVEAANTNLCEVIIESLPVPRILNAGADQFICELGSPFLSTILGDVNCENNLGNSYSWSAIPPADVGDLSNINSLQPTLNISWAGFLGQTLGFVLETQRNNCGGSTFDTVQVHLPISNSGFFEGDSIVLQANDCQSLVEVCMGISATQLPHYQVTNNGLPYPPAGFLPCNDSLFAVQLGTGYHELVATDTTTGCTDSLFVTVQCLVTDTIEIEMVLNSADTVCFSNDEIVGAIQTLENICLDGAFVGYELLDDSCVVITSNWVGDEVACFVACDNIGFCDTTILEISVLHPLSGGVKDSIVIEQLGEYCFDENLLNIGGPINSIQNLCPGSSGTSVNFSIDEMTQCVYYFGANLGVDTACVELCDALGNCDTINVCISVVPGAILYDTVFIEVDTNSFCLLDSLLPGEIISIEDVCPENNGEEVQFSFNGNCAVYYGNQVGVDTICIRFEDELGNVGLYQLIVNVVRTIPETICDSMFVEEIHSICLDTSELPGNFVYVEEICPDERTGNVDLIIDPVTLCVEYEGVTEGRDSACVVVCDDFGFCDSTFFCLQVAPYFDLPVVYEDTAYTEKGTPVVIDFLANDTLFGGVTDIYILHPPISGSVVLNLQNSFTYTPDDPFCARWDNFTYVACNPNGCDTTTVSIFIECIELTVFTAVSPNNDGVNDFFHIAKIEDFPDNHIWVYNRWGNLVFEKDEYENNWPGSWGEDIELPDGTYYYILEWSDGGTVTVQRGFIEMFR